MEGRAGMSPCFVWLELCPAQALLGVPECDWSTLVFQNSDQWFELLVHPALLCSHS